MSTTWMEPPAPAVLAGLRDVDDVVDKLSKEPTWMLSETDIDAAIVLAHREVCRLQGVLVGLVGEAGERGMAGVAGSPCATQWLRQKLRIAPAEAATYAHTAARVKESLTATGAALSSGDVNLTHASVIGRAVSRLGDDVPAGAKAAAEAILLDEAQIHDPVVLARIGEHVAARVDPDGHDARDGEALEREEERAARRMRLCMTPDGEGGTYLRGRLDALGSETLRAALDPLSTPRSDCPEGKDLRTAERRRADALVELARRALNHGDLPTAGGERPQVILTIPLSTLTTMVGTATLPSGQRVSAAHARALACDCGLIPAVLGARSQVLDLGRTRRLFTGPVRTAIILRDRGCAHPRLRPTSCLV